jgi:1,4-alpha-glucan branching enzyme
MSIESDIEALVGRDLADPHRLLGAHPDDGAVVVRAFRPAAAKIVARPQGGEPVQLTQRHPAGLFEGEIDGATLPLRYELEVEYGPGESYTLRDPYAFAPTLGEIDLYLAGEGRHQEL